MRSSRVLREIRAGQPATCIKINITNPRIVELAGLAGASAVWLCNEHVPTEWTTIENCVRAAKIHDTDVIVRVARGAYSDYVKPLEADATGIMVPHVASADEAREIVDMCRFHPLGRRALDGGNVDGAFCQIPMPEYLAASNREKFLVLQIESPEAVGEVEKIAAVPGYEFLLFGPGDYAHRIGQAGDIHHPEVAKARARVEDAARRHGKFLVAVGVAGTPQEQAARGYVLTTVGSDVHGLGQAFRDMLHHDGAPAGTASPYESRQ